MIVVMAIIGILGAAVAPSFTATIDGISVAQTVTNLQTALQDAQRQAIRKNQICTVQVSQKDGNRNGNQVTGSCLTSGSPERSDNVNLATNMQSANPNGSKKCVAISSTLGSTRVGVYTGSTAPTDITDKGVCTALNWKQQ